MDILKIWICLFTVLSVIILVGMIIKTFIEYRYKLNNIKILISSDYDVNYKTTKCHKWFINSLIIKIILIIIIMFGNFIILKYT